MSEDKDLRPKTKEEVRDEFMNHIWHLIDYWAEEAEHPEKAREVISGFAHSFLTTLDGLSMGMPGFEIRVRVHPSDKDFYKEQGENWYENGMSISDFWILNDILYEYDPRRD